MYVFQLQIWKNRRRTTENSNVATQTGSNCIVESMIDNVKIPTEKCFQVRFIEHRQPEVAD